MEERGAQRVVNCPAEGGAWKCNLRNKTINNCFPKHALALYQSSIGAEGSVLMEYRGIYRRVCQKNVSNYVPEKEAFGSSHIKDIPHNSAIILT